MVSIILIALMFLLLCIHVINNYLIYVRFPNQPPTDLEHLYSNVSYTKSRFYYRNMALMEGTKHFTQYGAFILLIAFGIFNNVDLWLRESFSSNYIYLGGVFLMLYNAFTVVLAWPFKAWERIIKDRMKEQERTGFDKAIDTIYCSTESLVPGVLSLIILAPFNFLLVWGLNNINQYLVLQFGVILILILIIFPEFFNRIVVPLKYKLDSCNNDAVVSSINELTAKINYKKPLVQVLRNGNNEANALVVGRKDKMRIMLDPKLIKEFPQNEINAILAHEFGHIQHRHTYKGMITIFGIFMIVFCVLLLVIYNPELAYHFGMQNTSVHISLVIALLFFQPLGLAAKVITNHQSQKKEKQADIFSARLTGDALSLVFAFKRIYQTNMVHPNLHRFTLLIDHTHPPLPVRIQYLLKEADSH